MTKRTFYNIYYREETNVLKIRINRAYIRISREYKDLGKGGEEMCEYMKLLRLIVLSLFLGMPGMVRGRTVTFTKVTVGSGLLYVPHGDWAGDIDGTSPPHTLDIFATMGFGEAVWYANLGNGTSWSAKNLIWTAPVNLCNFEIAGADLDKDGDMDAVSCDFGSGSSDISYLAVHTNTGGSAFTTKIIGNVDGGFRQMRLEDVDNDDTLDIVVSVNTKFSQSDIGVYWYENTGGMNFIEHFIGKCNAWKVDCFDDEPQDGHLEIVVSETYHGSGSTTDPCRLIFYKNDGFEFFTPTTLDTYAERAAGVRCAELNNDGKIDIISGNAISGVLYWYENMGSSSFTRHTIDNNCPDIDGIDVGDFEPDGDMDIVAAGRDYWFRWYENDGNGNFTPHTIDTEYEKFDLPYVTYLDGDTCPDIVLTEASIMGHVFAYLNPCPPPDGVEEKTGRRHKSEGISVSVYPNPATTKASIKFRVQGLELKNSQLATHNSQLTIYDLSGRLVRSLSITDNRIPITEVTWDERDAEGKKVNSGIYFYSIKYKDSGAKGKFIILK